MKEYSVVGKPLPRVDAKVKTTGEAKFAVDIKLPNMLHGKILRSPYPHAKIVKIDTSKAKALPGVKAVITGKDTGSVRFGFVDTPHYPADQYALAIEKVRYIGEEVAAVAAVDEITAAEALELIEIEYEELPAVFDPEEALKDGAPRIHDDVVPNTTCAWQDWGVGRSARTFKVKNNICAEVRFSHGDTEKGFAESDHVREIRTYAPSTQHAAMEPHVAVASYDSGSGKLDVWLTHMSMAVKRYWLSKTLGIPEGKVRLNRCYTGGTFGGKIDLFAYEFLAGFLSRMTGRPVKIELSRQETFTVCRMSHRMICNVKIGVKKDGRIMAQHVKLINDPGAYRGSSPVVMFLGHSFRNPLYNIPNWKHEGVGVYTNKAICMPKRGHGSPQVSFATEQLLDMIAGDIGMDPAELRLKNVRKTGDVMPNGDKIDSCGLSVGIEKTVKESGWKKKRGKGRDKYRGVGMALAGMFSGAMYYPFASAAVIKMNSDNTATLFTGSSEFGQGSDTAMSQIAAEALCLELDDIILVSGDSELTPIDLGGFVSSGTYVTGEAIRRAAVDAKNQLLACASEILKVPVENLEAKNGRVSLNGYKDMQVTYSEIVQRSIQTKNGDPIIGKGHAKAIPEVEFYPSLSKGQGRFTDAYGFSVNVAEVEVDPETGVIKVLGMWVGDDCGQAINPKNVHGQLISQAVMGLGDALFEQVEFNNGKVANPSFEDYKIPSVYEAPTFYNISTNTSEPKGPYGAKEVGECSRASAGIAIVNAVADAVGGVEFLRLPLTPERVLEAIERAKK
ncbi:MAG TPA: molybdopterin-dependent oxidoreductase [Desulfobacteraceae bacterium]|nr:molybdopterin-dependent oxidoreductase [Desulfobacteraceae bacterium]HPJ67709.1 molybdopterin-dependent oxidoreductase [Desulfobacteraceae bacterium]HPQ29422.1 molybdopterin-dependent oxidoreductase [Desulfobacteraceae bacterium]